MDTPMDTPTPWPEGHHIMQFHDVFHRRPINVGVIAGDLWQAHSR